MQSFFFFLYFLLTNQVNVSPTLPTMMTAATWCISVMSSFHQAIHQIMTQNSVLSRCIGMKPTDLRNVEI